MIIAFLIEHLGAFYTMGAFVGLAMLGAVVLS